MYDSYGDGWHGNSIEINGEQFGADFTTGYESNGSVTLEPGCYQMTVGMNDGSALDSGSYQNEITWELGGNSGGAPFDDLICVGGATPDVEPAAAGDTYDVNMYDSYGDGWHGNTISLNGELFGTDFTTGYESYDSVNLEPGCYDITVGMNDGSALDSGAW